MRKVILVIITTLFFIGVNGQVTTSIPDANFEQELINLGLDNGAIDGVVLTASVDTVTVLDVGFRNISSLTGIEDFSALTSLYCRNNQLTSLDVSQNIALTNLVCLGNQLTNIDVTQNTDLIDLNCGDNQLTSLDVSQNIELTNLVCLSNQLTTIDVTQNTALTDLNCGNNQLTSLDVSQNITLIILGCFNNQLISLDVSQNITLTNLLCFSNQLTCLNVKNGNNSNFSYFFASGNPNLSCVEVDDVAWSTANWTNIDAGVSFGAGCFDACSAVGIDESGFVSSFSLYPNPASNSVTIDFEKEEQLVALQIFNVYGQEMFAKEYKNIDIVRLDVEMFSSGTYFTRIITNEGIKTVKFNKQ